MTGRVIQGFFTGGRVPSAIAFTGPAHAIQAPRRPGPPPLAWPGAVSPVQAHAAPGRPQAAHPAGAPPVQRHGGGSESFAIDPVRLGLARGGGSPLPQPLLARMEAALGADFSAVRVHLGPQASRIGAVAFTTGNDLYFAPGSYRPETMQGRQLIGHELAHVIQQRQGRVRAPASGIAVVRDHALEAEADRLGQRAAIQRQAATPGRHRTVPSAHGSIQPMFKPDFPTSKHLDHKFKKSSHVKPWGGGRPGFWEKTKDYMFGSRGSTRMTRYEYMWAKMADPNEILYRCEDCNEFYPKSSMQIDHVYPWDNIVKEYLEKNSSISEAAELYNNIYNLQLLCTPCNESKKAKVNASYDFSLLKDRVEKFISVKKGIERVRAELESLTKLRTHKFFD